MFRNILDSVSRSQKEPDNALSIGETINSPSLSAISRVRWRTDPLAEEDRDTKRHKAQSKNMIPVKPIPKLEGDVVEGRLIRKLWRTDPEVEGTDETNRTEDRSSRIIMIPVNCDSEYAEAGFLLGPGGSRIRTLEAEASGRLKINLRGEGRSNSTKEPPHVLLEGEPACVDKAASVINTLIQIPKISRKVMIPARPGLNYGSMLIGPGGSRIRAVVAEAGGLVSILVRDGKLTGNAKKYDIKDEPPHVFLYGESSCVERAETMICDMLQIQNNIARKIMVPAYSGYDYGSLLVGNGGSTVKALEAEAGGRVSILVRDGKRTGATKRYDTKGEAPHVLLEGEASCVNKAERLIDDLWNFQVVSRKLVIPAGYDYPRLLIGQGAGILKTLRTEAGGRVDIHVRDGMGVNGWHGMNEPPYLLLVGEASCVHKAESIIMDLFQIADRERTDNGNTSDFNKPIVATSNNNGRSVLGRVHALATDLGLKFNPGDALCSKVMRLENEIFSQVKSGTIKERIGDLEKEIGC